MNHEIDFRNKSKIKWPAEEIEELVRQHLERFDDAESAEWVTTTLQKMSFNPELAFSFSFSAPVPADENELRRIGEEYGKYLEEKIRAIVLAMIITFLRSYVSGSADKES